MNIARTFIDTEAFLSAPCFVAPNVLEKLFEIKKTACFHQSKPVFDYNHAAKMERMRLHSKCKYKSRSRNAFTMPDRTTNYGCGVVSPLRVHSTISDEHRSINDIMNKMTTSNYSTLSRTMKIIMTDENILFAMEKILESSYIQTERCAVYVRLVTDICNSLSEAQMRTVKTYLRMQLQKSMDEPVTIPFVDPVKDYTVFCSVTKQKARSVGRCNAFCKFLRGFQRDLQKTPEQYFDHHTELVFQMVKQKDIGEDIDVAASIEMLLDCILIMVNHYEHLRTSFQTSLKSHDMSDFPSSRCKFKVMDILGT